MKSPIPPQFSLRQYAYDLPDELIAQYPLEQRDGAKLLHLLPTGAVEDTNIKNLAKYLLPGDLLVLNNSKVLPMRIFGHKQAKWAGQADTGISKNNDTKGSKVEILITSIKDERHAEALIKASRSPKPGSRIIIGTQPQSYKQNYFVVDAISNNGTYRLSTAPDQNIKDLCDKYGLTPLPPYIKREADTADRQRYQTIYAKQTEQNKHQGSAAAPTAGLHFSSELLTNIKNNGIDICELTLDVGLGTFAPIRSNDIREHKMHSEFCQMPEKVSSMLNQAKSDERRIVAVGTTSLRVLESFYDSEAHMYYSGSKDTNIFIYPGGRNITTADLLLTNFHQPSSSLLLLVCAFSGYEQIMYAYQHAINDHYRFFSYGDACLLHRKT